MKATSNLYQEVVNVTYEYLGPAADRFVSRQVSHHLNKNPNQLKEKDLADLVDWFRLAMALLCDDVRLVDNYVTALIRLSDKTQK
jgi:hypothetical protein